MKGGGSSKLARMYYVPRLLFYVLMAAAFMLVFNHHRVESWFSWAVAGALLVWPHVAYITAGSDQTRLLHTSMVDACFAGFGIVVCHFSQLPTTAALAALVTLTLVMGGFRPLLRNLGIAVVAGAVGWLCLGRPIAAPLAIPPVPATLMGAAIVIHTGGIAYLSYAAMQTVQTQRRELRQLQHALEQRVEERSREVDALAAQLQFKVRERSAALAKALDGVSATELEPGHVLDGRIDITRQLGRGGMGSVYQGTDRVMGARVAVKLLRPELSDESAIRRFLREAEVVGRVADPRIVRTHHVDVTADGQLYQVMEYVEGVTLERHLKSGMPPVSAALRIAAQIAGALEAAHAAGIIHRDIKPANVMLTPAGPGLRLLDFGIAKLEARSDAAAGETKANHVLGTPIYMSPEQVRPQGALTTATDIYSLGVMLFELLAGQPPFSSKNTAELFSMKLEQPAPALHGAGESVPPAVVRLVARCLERDPTQRPDAASVVAALSRAGDELGAPSLPLRGLGTNDSRDGGTGSGTPVPPAAGAGGASASREEVSSIGTDDTWASDA